VANPRKPTALKVLNGSDAHHPERRNLLEPKAELLTAVPEPPAHIRLTGRARRAWDHLAVETVALGILTSADLAALASVCLDWAEYMRARVDAESWRRADSAKRRYDAGLARFGLNPSDRSKVRTVPKTTESKMTGLLTPRRKSG